LVGGEAIQGFHNVHQPDLFGRDSQGETARRTLARTEQAFTRKLLEDFGKEMRGDLLLLGDVLHHGVPALRHLCQVYKGADRVFCRSGVDHTYLLVFRSINTSLS
jgi:hypothetical protein